MRRAMIAAMPEPPDRPLSDWPSDPDGYTSASRSAYTVVYTHAKEVS